MDDLRWVVDEALALGASFADVRYAEGRSIELEARDGEVRRVVPGDERGASVRVLVGGRASSGVVSGAWGHAATNRLTRDALKEAVAEAVRTARALASRPGDKVRLAAAPAVTDKAVWSPARDATRADVDDVARIVLDAERAAREEPRVVTARLSFEASVTTTRLWNSDGSDVTKTVPLLLLQYDLAAKEGGGAPVGYRARIGGTRGLEVFEDEDPIEKAREAAAGAVRLLTAKPCPSGRMTVIADPDLAGVFAHEAVGHACEADLVIAGDSLLEGRIGETIGSEIVTIVDDGGIRGGFGSLPYDDEGVRAGRKVLVERGVLAGFIHSRETAGKLGDEPNGGARAQGVGSRPLVRMSNTLIEAGDHEFEELFDGIERGVFAKGTRGGQVDVAKGSFQFGAQEAWLIENGELTTPLKDAALQGSILETLNGIDALGKDSRLASPGICGKGQLVPVGDGGPHVRIRGAIVGGGA